MTKVIVVNGPNLGRLGVRQPDVYGRQDLDTLRKLCAEWGKDLGLEVEVRQTDDEAEMVHWMHQAADEKTPVVMNPPPSRTIRMLSPTPRTWSLTRTCRLWKSIFPTRPPATSSASVP